MANDLVTYKPDLSGLPVEETKEADVTEARDNLVQILEVGQTALKEMAELATASQNPDYYETLSGMLKNLSDISGKLVDLHKNAASAKKADKGMTVTGNIFLSTKDVAEAMRKAENEDS